jgi:hypothetical protein
MMPMPQQPHPPPITPGKATANRALGLTFYGSTGNSQQRDAARQLGAMICWDAAMNVAVNAGGIQHVAHILATQFNQMFPVPHPVPDANAAIMLPIGCFVGFTDSAGTTLKHVMIHVGVGWAAGTNNSAMFPNNYGHVWQLINLTEFFGSDPYRRGGNRMIYRTVDGTGL